MNAGHTLAGRGCRVRLGSAPLSVLLTLAAAGGAVAQTGSAPEVGFSSIPFQFFPPGARSLAMGATFVGIADDATAAASNPAGLMILTRPEASFHARYTNFSSSVGGGYSQPSTDSFNASYASAVYPVKPLSLSLYYQEVSRIALTRSFSGEVQFPFLPVLTPYESTSQIDLLVADLGVSAGLKLGDRLSLGATAARRKVRLSYANQNTIVGDETFHDQATADGSDTALVFNAGILVNPNGRFSFGLVYKRGGRFEFPYSVVFDGAPAGPVDCPAAGTCDTGPFQIPDTWGAGLAFRPSSRWLFAADAALVRYSQLSTTLFRAIPSDIYPIPSPANDLPPARFQDVVEVHGGVERIISGRPSVCLRAGAFYRPDFNEAGGVDTGASFVTFGLGLVFGDRGQLDLAGSISGGIGEGLASFVIRF